MKHDGQPKQIVVDGILFVDDDENEKQKRYIELLRELEQGKLASEALKQTVRLCGDEK